MLSRQTFLLSHFPFAARFTLCVKGDRSQERTRGIPNDACTHMRVILSPMPIPRCGRRLREQFAAGGCAESGDKLPSRSIVQKEEERCDTNKRCASRDAQFVLISRQATLARQEYPYAKRQAKTSTPFRRNHDLHRKVNKRS